METPAPQQEFSRSAKPDLPISDQTSATMPNRGLSSDEITFQLGAWLSGLAIFLDRSGQLNDVGKVASASENFVKEIRIARDVLHRCSSLAFDLAMATASQVGSDGISHADARTLVPKLREPLLTANALVRNDSLNFVEWQAWCIFANEWLNSDPVLTRVMQLSDVGGAAFLPKRLREIIESSRSTGELGSPIAVVLPRFGRVLRTLDIVGELLERDEPMKIAVIIFAKAAHQTRELIAQLDQFVKRAGEDGGELSVVLDSASYMTSLELKKVMQQELSGVLSLRPATSIYARSETSYALLTESLQQILAQFAKHIDPAVDIFDLFPNFRNKLDQSLLLRKELHTISQIARHAEKESEQQNIDKLNASLTRFMETSVRFLFYKDIETFERFVEEIAVTKQKKDVVPIVHRFGAYLETLFGQVCMRAVLEKHPFDG